MTNCGPGGMGDESCCTSPEVTPGSYNRTYTNLGNGPTAEADPATVSGFRLDKYLVTVGRFRQYVNYLTGEAGAPPANGSGIHTYLNGGQGLSDSHSPGTYETGWDAADWNMDIATGPGAASTWDETLGAWGDDGMAGTWTSTAGSQEGLPVDCVSWDQAYAFCIWDGGFLPSEAEWGYTAAAGSQEREYPWGSTDPGTANQYAITNCDYPSGASACASAGPGNIAPVGTAALGAGYWGQLDLAGEVWEWTADWIGPYGDPCTDCAALTVGVVDGGFVGGLRAIRGGDFAPGTGLLFPFTRSDAEPGPGSGGIGFRCARAP